MVRRALIRDTKSFNYGKKSFNYGKKSFKKGSDVIEWRLGWDRIRNEMSFNQGKDRWAQLN